MLGDMKLMKWEHLVDTDGLRGTVEFSRFEHDIRAAVDQVRWPPGADRFTIYPIKQANGVVPIKSGFVECLRLRGWIMELDKFDCHLTLDGCDVLPFVVEWETGNISSSHRAVNRIALGAMEGRISGGVLVVPSRVLYNFLTDRVGNDAELEPYKPLWRRWDELPGLGYLGIITVEHDTTSMDAEPIAKGTDGRALI